MKTTATMGFMRHLLALLIILAALLACHVAYARGGQDADDCPPGSTDPDCKDASQAAPKGK
jgi:hypothetical protein